MKNKEISIKKRRRKSNKGSIEMNVAIGVTVLIIIFAIVVLVIALNEARNKNAGLKEPQSEKVTLNSKEENKKEESNKTEQGEKIKAEEREIVLENNEYMHVETDAEGKKVPVPNGYVGSSVGGENEENRINTGYVIYEGEEEVTEANVEEARKTRNQYVWVPVPDASKIYGTDSKGKKWGKLYSFSTTGGDEITGTSPYNWSESNGVMKITSTTRDREPDILKERDKDSILKTLGLGVKTMNEFNMEMNREFARAIKSIEKYGGYYIGRYETGGLNGTVKIVKGETNIASQTWYTMYKKCKELAGTNRNVETGMIWGCEQDRVLMWLIESGNKTKEQVCKDSVEWGNYSNNAVEYVTSSGSVATASGSTRIPAGASEQTKANNIYDLAGNVWDWGMEANSTNGRRYRGGNYYYYSTSYPASYRYYYIPTYDYGYYGCRATLYIR